VLFKAVIEEWIVKMSLMNFWISQRELNSALKAISQAYLYMLKSYIKQFGKSAFDAQPKQIHRNLSNAVSSILMDCRMAPILDRAEKTKQTKREA